jgi:hypothetical protein
MPDCVELFLYGLLAGMFNVVLLLAVYWDGPLSEVLPVP